MQFSFPGSGLSAVTATLNPGNPGVATTPLALPATLNQGVYMVDASYSDPNSPTPYNASSGTGTLTLQTAASTVNASDTNSPLNYNSGGETLDVQANVTSTNGGPVKEGDVVFTVDGVSSSPLAVSNGVATDTVTLPAASVLIAGNYLGGISASYTDTASNNYAAANAAADVSITSALTTTTLPSPNVGSTYNGTTAQTVTLTAAVASASGDTVNKGNVLFTATNPNGANLTTPANVRNGTATATLTVPAGFAIGSYAFNASYTDTTNANGQTNYAASTTVTPGTLTVTANPVATTTTTLTSSALRSTYNSTTSQTVTLTAAVASTSTVNEGAVLFTVTNPHGANLTTTANVRNGTATATLTVPVGFAAGAYSLTARYADPNNAINYGPSSATMPGTLTVTAAATTTTITPTNASTTYNSTTPQTVTLSAAVASAEDGAVNEGNVLFTVTNPRGANLTTSALSATAQPRRRSSCPPASPPAITPSMPAMPMRTTPTAKPTTPPVPPPRLPR